MQARIEAANDSRCREYAMAENVQNKKEPQGT
jgi:hypothetical protein